MCPVSYPPLVYHPVHFTVDKVESKVSSDDYLDLRVILLDKFGKYRSINLSIREYPPSSTLKHNDIQASVVLKTWHTYSFKEFDFDVDSIQV